MQGFIILAMIGTEKFELLYHPAIANFMPSFPDTFRLAPSPPELKTIWPIIEHPNNVTYILICIVDTQYWQVKTCQFM